MLSRRCEAFNAALLPHQKPEAIRAEIEQLQYAMMEFDGAVNISATEDENTKLIKERKAHAKRVLAARKAAGKPARKKNKIPPKARRIQ